MSRKTMTREVTKTTVKVAKIAMQEGAPVMVELPEQTFIGNVKLDKAQRLVQKTYDHPITVLEVQPETKIYEMELSQFIELATVKTVETNEQ